MKGGPGGGLPRVLARYDFDTPNAHLWIDSFATGNGLLRGRPVRSGQEERALSFEGRDQSVELPRCLSPGG